MVYCQSWEEMRGAPTVGYKLAKPCAFSHEHPNWSRFVQADLPAGVCACVMHSSPSCLHRKCRGLSTQVPSAGFPWAHRELRKIWELNPSISTINPRRFCTFSLDKFWSRHPKWTVVTIAFPFPGLFPQIFLKGRHFYSPKITMCSDGQVLFSQL